jgi:hypothetical protein
VKNDKNKSNDPSSRASRGDVIRYYIDLFLSKGAYTRFIGLFGISSGHVLICSILVLLVSPPDSEHSGSFVEALWWSTMRVIDAGNMAGDTGGAVRFVAALATLSGIFVVALLIGLVSTTVGEKIEDLRRGKSAVIDSGHTLILGFSEKVFTIVTELIIANESERTSSIVILSELEKSLVEERIRDRIPETKKTRIVVRQGSAFSPQTLKKVGAGRV